MGMFRNPRVRQVWRKRERDGYSGREKIYYKEEKGLALEKNQCSPFAAKPSYHATDGELCPKGRAALVYL